ncbi:beta-lactamase family protein [Pendulispora brunnea]|uniref:Beta-lactamase family protein n=1 Tax=Pendulispora brunnea TaxID=2905690 RepID=A0ABZ2JX67_9BACT
MQRDADALREAGAPGVLALANLDGDVVRTRSGVADVKTNAPIAENATFRAASVTKTFVATVVLQLVAEKKLALDDTLERWLPEVLVPKSGNDGSKVTLRNLLQQTSGLYDYRRALPADETEASYLLHRFDTYTKSELIKKAMEHAPDFIPNPEHPRWQYSNTNYLLLSRILEKVTGQDWERAIEERIFDRLHLSGAKLPGNDAQLPSPYLAGYERFASQGEWVDVTVRSGSAAGAAGSLVATTDDLDRFFRALADGTLLPAAEWAEMQKTVVADDYAALMPGIRYGLGVFWYPLSCGGGYWNGLGDTLGYMVRTAVTADGRRSAVVAVSTDQGHDTKDLVRQDALVRTLIDHALCAPMQWPL